MNEATSSLTRAEMQCLPVASNRISTRRRGGKSENRVIDGIGIGRGKAEATRMQENLPRIEKRNPVARGDFLGSICDIHYCGRNNLRVAHVVTLKAGVAPKTIGVQ